MSRQMPLTIASECSARCLISVTLRNTSCIVPRARCIPIRGGGHHGGNIQPRSVSAQPWGRRWGALRPALPWPRR